MTVLYWLLPDEFLPVLVVVCGIGLVVGLLRPRSAGAIVGTVVLILLIGPFVESLFAALPLWVSLAVLSVFVLSISRRLLGSLLGEHAAGHVIGTLFLWSLKTLFKVAWLPVRGVAWLAMAAIGRR